MILSEHDPVWHGSNFKMIQIEYDKYDLYMILMKMLLSEHDPNKHVPIWKWSKWTCSFLNMIIWKLCFFLLISLKLPYLIARPDFIAYMHWSGKEKGIPGFGILTFNRFTQIQNM